jgi:hypothetical protein
MNPAFIAALVATLAQTVVVPAGFGRPWFEPAAAKRVHTVRHQPPGTVHVALPKPSCQMPAARPQGDVDPKIVVEPPKGVGFAIRTVEAPCR